MSDLRRHCYRALGADGAQRVKVNAMAATEKHLSEAEGKMF